MAWAGTIDDFKRHVEVCSAPEVDWCDSRVRISQDAQHRDLPEKNRGRSCREAFTVAAGGLDAAMMVAPCTAYGTRKHPALAETVENYNLKLDGLRATVEDLIESRKIRVIAFQEVKSEEVIEQVLGKFAGQFAICVASHTAFQTIAFAWDKSIPSGSSRCSANQALAITERPGQELAHRLRPGLALELVINGSPVTFLNIHLKSGCANLKTAGRFPGRRLTDPDPACMALNRQIPILEDWVEQIGNRSPRFVLLGDFNRRIDEEARTRIPKTEVRSDGSDPAGPNIGDESGHVKSNYLWQEIADGVPPMYQVPLTSTEPGCAGFRGLDHIVISGPVRRAQTAAPRSSKTALIKRNRQSIATSDHCPRITVLEL
ncbi:MAG TPA: hypothetical protein VF780_01300 [Nitrosospira sp.]